MGDLDTVKAFNAAINGQQWDTLATMMTDDFTFEGATPRPQNKQEFIAGNQAWHAGVPDWHAELQNLREEGATIRGTTIITGTQTNALALPGMPPFPATGRHFSSPNEMAVTLRGGQVAALRVLSSSPGIFEQLGVPMPPTPPA